MSENESSCPCSSVERKAAKPHALPSRQRIVRLLRSSAILFLIAATTPAIGLSEDFESLYARANAKYRQGSYKEALKLYKSLETDYAQSYFGYDASLKVKKLEAAK